MKNFITIICLVLSGILLFSFKVGKKERAKNAALVGVWMTGEITDPNTSHMKVFNEDGSFYEIHFDNGVTVMSHKGMYKILDDQHYQETVTNTRFNGPYDLKGKTFTNRYEMSKDKQKMVLSGTVYSKNGSDSLKWSHVYKRVQIPE
jgi:hypothetical protein